MGHRLLIICLITSLLASYRTSAALAETPAFEHTQTDYDFFETSVRPLLLSACGKCHGATTTWANLRIDSKEALLVGGDTGPAIVPGDLEESLLIASVRRTGDYDMPPDKPLSPAEVAILEQWVSMGAPWPETDGTAMDRTDLHQTHWAFQPISHPVPPAAIDPQQVKSPVDLFIQSKLAESGLKGSPSAEKDKLIRRITYDLTGLPPTYEAVQNFLNDPDEAAYERIVEQLLNSPEYGEHLARSWLDLARFADTKGYVYGREERRFVHSWNYRDWVIDAFQNDMPYDKFLLYQIAADQYAPQDESAQAAMGFLTVGRRFLGNLHDVYDDRIDVLGRTTMGLTISCARCHDHKYDPIPTADYYSLYGVFQNSPEQYQPLNSTLMADVDDPVMVEYNKRVQAYQEQTKIRQAQASQRVRDRFADYLFAQTEPDKYPDVAFSQILGESDIIPSFVFQVSNTLRESRKSDDPIFLIWNRLFNLPADGFESAAQTELAAIKEDPSLQVHPLVLAKFETAPASMRETADRYGELFKEIDLEWQTAVKSAADLSQPAPTELTDLSREALRQVLYGKLSPTLFPDDSMTNSEFHYDTGVTVELWALRSAIDAWIIENGEKLPFTTQLVDRDILVEPRIFRRGNSATKGEEITRHFPTVIAGSDSPAFEHGSGRLELAQGIVDPTNPLTARVWVNRIWQTHFGVGIVPTSSDFGTRAAEPEHLALLDWLAQELINNNWSTKHIHRLIMLSSAYRQATTGPISDADLQLAKELDPENKLIWKANIHRLTFEELRDSMLAVSGKLDLQSGGPAGELFDQDKFKRRTIYGFVDRQFLPTVFRTFDFANPDLHIPNRAETTVSQQALFGLNSPFVAKRSEDLAESVTSSNSDVNTQVVELFRNVLQRDPTPQQLQRAVDYLKISEPLEDQAPPASAMDQWSYGYGNVTDAGLDLATFTPLPYLSSLGWQGGPNWPDTVHGWAQLSPVGGHPGVDGYSVVRRWTPDVAGTFSITSSANHEPSEGNGIRAWIISSRQGVLKTVNVYNSTKELNLDPIQVESGETIDFVVDMNGDLGFDQFLWSISLTRTVPVEGALANWNSEQDFTKAKFRELTPWQQLAQVLLLSNEFLFVD